jgi:hypothetical protein
VSEQGPTVANGVFVPQDDRAEAHPVRTLSQHKNTNPTLHRRRRRTDGQTNKDKAKCALKQPNGVLPPHSGAWHLGRPAFPGQGGARVEDHAQGMVSGQPPARASRRARRAASRADFGRDRGYGIETPWGAFLEALLGAVRMGTCG